MRLSWLYRSRSSQAKNSQTSSAPPSKQRQSPMHRWSKCLSHPQQNPQKRSPPPMSGQALSPSKLSNPQARRMSRPYHRILQPAARLLPSLDASKGATTSFFSAIGAEKERHIICRGRSTRQVKMARLVCSQTE